MMKTGKIFLALAVVAGILLLCGLTLSDARAVAPTPNAMSGGSYLLTIETTTDPQPGGYRLLDAGTEADETSGCCCTNYLPCINR
jgi:hypothetical protein